MEVMSCTSSSLVQSPSLLIMPLMQKVGLDGPASIIVAN